MNSKELAARASTIVSVAGAVVAALAPDYGLYGIAILLLGLASHNFTTNGQLASWAAGFWAKLNAIFSR